MGATQTGWGKALKVALVVIGLSIAGYLGLMVLVLHAMQEPYPFLDVHNESGRPLLIEQADAVSYRGTAELGVLAWRPQEGWPTGSYECEQEQLVARDLNGAVVARRAGACPSDSWTITAEDLSAAPRYQRASAPADHVEIRLVLDPYSSEAEVAAWWRALPRTLERAAAAGSATGVSVHGPFVEDRDLTLYVRGQDAATVLEFARTQVLRPSPGRVYAFVSAPGEPAPQTGTPVLLDATTTPSAPTR
ncbi:hypothetical protein ASG96_18020 [Terrabacter sp. Soil810]|nr:hypothetical protein ASG96_18020 [Terrabacter sp. Soil810]